MSAPTSTSLGPSPPPARPIRLRESDLAAFARFRVGPELLAQAQVQRVTDAEAREKYGITGNGDMAGTVFPYRDPLTGVRCTARLRRDNPEIEDGKPKNKYLCPYGDRHHLYFPPGCAERVRDSTVPIVLVEAEKSALALTAWGERCGRKMLPVAMGGCWGWRGRIGKGANANGECVDEVGPLPDLKAISSAGRDVYVLLDTNCTSNSKVQQARAALVQFLKRQRAKAHVLDLPPVSGVNGPDDYIAVQGDDAMGLLFDAADAGVTNMIGSDPTPKWPEPLKPEAFHGLAGEIVRALEPYSEADPAALLVQLLVGFGNLLGRRPYYRVEDDTHFSNEFLVLAGPTSKARKGTSWTRIRKLLEQADPTWATRLMPGLSSGEGVVHQVRDATGADPGEPDKRLMVVEPEFASVLATMARQGNTLSPVLRQAWDGGRLGNPTKKASETCAEPHISTIGHVTVEELRRSLDRTELANGFANRFLFMCVRRSKQLPDGACIPDKLRDEFAERLRAAFKFARTVNQMSRDGKAYELWHQVYGPLSEGRAGLLGAVIGRAEAHVLRLSCLYALLDSKSVVGFDHLKAALTLWKYAEDSASFIFGDATGDPVADTILKALRTNPEGMNRTQISELFARNLSKTRIDNALASLQAQGTAHVTREGADAGRPSEIWLYGPTKKTN